jgi:hypothetical protein
MKKPKQINLSEGAIKALSIEAINKGTNFKNYVEDNLEQLAVRLLAVRQKRLKNNSH